MPIKAQPAVGSRLFVRALISIASETHLSSTAEYAHESTHHAELSSRIP